MNEIKNFMNGVMPEDGGMLTNVLVAIALLVVGWIIARLVSGAIGKLVKKTPLESKVAETAGSFSLGGFLQKIIFYFLMLFVLLMVLGKLGINEVLEPIENLVNSLLSALPHILYAGVVGVFGYFLAKIVSELVGILAGSIEKLAVKMQMSEPSALVGIVKKLVFIIIFIPILIQAIDLLNLEAISTPAKSMLATFIGVIPKIIAAAIIIALFFFIGRYITSLLKGILKSFGTDDFAQKLGLGNMLGKQSLSNLIGNVIFFFIMFLGIISGVEKLEFANLSEVLSNLLNLSGGIMFGLVIMVFGNFLSTLVFETLSKSEDNKFVANIARWAILGMFVAISLRAMGIANEIVYLAFGLTLGAVAIAFALMFGLGGREAAGKHVAHILEKFRK
ncbi:MAG: mechanosensitive ion channel [Flavobacteriaceae bacterium]|nr:mechanosensitive ion channel [Flavobacteriaceae bacterium]